MLKVLTRSAVPLFELVGASLIVAGVYVLTGLGWAFVAAGVLALVKAFDLSLPKAD